MSNIALFVDFENIGYQTKFDIGSMINSLKSKGRVILKKAYADWSYFEKHKKIAKWTYPIWLYVSLTGIIVYLMIEPYY